MLRSGRDTAKSYTALAAAALLLTASPNSRAEDQASEPEASGSISLHLNCLAKIPIGSLVKGKMALISRSINGRQQELLCVGGGSDLHVYDISDPSNPTLLLKKNFSGDTAHHVNDLFEVIHSGNYLVLTGSYQGGDTPERNPAGPPLQVGWVLIIDISAEDPTQWKIPEGKAQGRWASFLEDEHSYTCSDVALRGEVGKDGCLLHVSGNFRRTSLGGNFILDLSDPGNPRKRGEIRYVKGEANYHGHGICVDDRYEYHGNYYRGIYLVDYQDPDNLKVVSDLAYPLPKDAVRQLAVNGDLLYTTVTVAGRQNYDTGHPGVAIIDVSDRTSPKFFSQTIVPREDMPISGDVAHDSPPHKISFFNDKKNLLINLGSKGLALFDIGTDPEKAVYLGLAELDEVPRGTRPMAWNDHVWVIGDGPHFVDGGREGTEPQVYLYRWAKGKAKAASH